MTGEKVGIAPEMLPVMKRAYTVLCKGSTGVLFETKLIRVGVKHEYKGKEGRASVFFQTNKNEKPLKHFYVEVESVPYLQTQVTPTPAAIMTPPGLNLAAHSQSKIVILMQLIGEFTKSPTIKVCFETQDGKQHEYPLLLPITAAHFDTSKKTKPSPPPKTTHKTKADDGTEVIVLTSSTKNRKAMFEKLSKQNSQRSLRGPPGRGMNRAMSSLALTSSSSAASEYSRTQNIGKLKSPSSPTNKEPVIADALAKRQQRAEAPKKPQRQKSGDASNLEDLKDSASRTKSRPPETKVGRGSLAAKREKFQRSMSMQHVTASASSSTTPDRPFRRGKLLSKSPSSRSVSGSDSDSEVGQLSKARMGRFSRENSENSIKSSESTPKVISQKVPKIIKSLQSGSFMSAEHIPKVLRDCLSIIQNNPGNQLELGKSNSGVRSIVTMMERFEEDATIQQLACQCIESLSEVHNENRQKLADCSGLKQTLIGVLTHIKVPDVQIAGLGALSNLAKLESNKLLIHDSQGLEVMKVSMDENASNLDVQAQIFRTMAALADLRLIARAFNAMKMSKVVVTYMQEYPQNENIQQFACRAIRSLCENDDVSRGSLSSAGAIEACIQAMKHFESNAAIQEEACAALMNITIQQSLNCQQVIAYQKNEALSLIVKALKTHQSVADVQEAGCGILHNLSDTEENAKIVGRFGALIPVLNAMRQHENSKGVQAQGFCLLCNFAMVEELKAPMLGEGGIGMIVFAMRQLEEYVDMQKQACRALRNLATDDQNKISIGACGGIAAMLSAMERHSENAAMQVLALKTIEGLTSVPRNRKTILTNNGIAIIEATIAKYPSEQVIEEKGKSVLQQVKTEV